MTNDNRRIVLVTGAGRGLGWEVTRQLLDKGHVVVAGTRGGSQPSGERSARGELHTVQLDVCDAASLREASSTIAERLGRLDVLVNNAGVMIDGSWGGNSTLAVPLSALRQTFETNVFALVDVSRIMLPLLRRGKQACIVNVSSIMGSLSIHADANGFLKDSKPFAYDASKAAVNAFTIHLAAALRGENIRVNSVHPGWVRTALGTDAAPLSVEEGARAIVSAALDTGPETTGRFLQAQGEVPW